MVVFVIVIAGMFAPSALATTPLSGSKTATAHWKRTFEWTIDKTATPAAHTLETGQSGTSAFRVAVTKGAGTDTMWVDGDVCVTNNGAIATEGLAIRDLLRAFDSNGTTIFLNVDTMIDVSANPVLDPGESHCYGYSLPFAPVQGAVGYENRARATITNDPREPGTPLGPSFDADFIVPTSPTLVNDAVNVDDTNGMSWTFSASGSVSYTRTFTCDRDKGTHSNTATIRQTGQSASASVAVTCKDKPSDCPKGHKGKKKKDGHGYGHGYGDRGDDRQHSGYSTRGRDDDDCKDDPGGGHDDDSDDSSDDSNDSDDSDDGDCKGDRRGWDD